MIDGNKGHKQIKTLVKSLDEVRRQGKVNRESGGHPLSPPPTYLLTQVLYATLSPRGT
jgi:hypothetical protein